MNDLIQRLVDKFLSWPLPESVCSDLCVTKPGLPNRIGTNLLNAEETRQMLEHVVGPELKELTGDPLTVIAALRRKGWNAAIKRAAEVADHYAELMNSQGAQRAADEIRTLISKPT